MNRILFLYISLLVFLPLVGQPAFCAERSSRYVTLSYTDKALLRSFNDRLVLGKRLSYHLRKKNLLTVADEVLAKVDLIIEKAEIVLDMFPNNLHIKLVLLPSAKDVARVYQKKYGKSVNHIAYYSLSEKTIYISVRDTKLKVLAHEVGHAVVDRYFKVRPPYNIHELMAQFTEKHITD
jgi:hypothetical protein